MSNLDDKIKQALSEQDSELLEEFSSEQSIFEIIGDTFRGRQRWLVVLMYIYSVVFFGLAIFTAVKFFQVESTRELIAWAVGFLFCTMAVTMLKMWYFMEMNKNAITREVKRLELQIARLASRIGE